MAEDPVFSGFSTGDAADAFAKVVSGIKSDMAAIEASAKNIEKSLGRASRSRLGGGSGFGAQNAGGGTGFSKDQGMSLGEISGRLGGARGIATTAGFGVGGLAGLVSGSGFMAGGLALAGLPDLIMRPERALNMEAARFGMAQATGDFGTFRSMMDVARNGFNVQNEQAFMNTMVVGTQRMGMVGMMSGGTLAQRQQQAASQIGGYNTMAAMAGIDQTAVPGVMANMMSPNAYYTGMASGIMTRNPVTGEPIGVEGQINQLWKRAGLQGMTEDQALQQIDINYGYGTAGELELLQMYGGDRNAVEMVKEGLRIRVRQGGAALTENQVQEQMNKVGAAGGLGTEMTQGMEGTRALESAKMNLGAETLNAATAGIEEATKHITSAVDLLAELPPELAKIRDAYVTLANQMDVFQTELPTATSGITDFFMGLPGVLLQALGLNSLLSKGGGLLSKAGPLLKSIPKAGPLAAGAAVITGGGWAVNKVQEATGVGSRDFGVGDWFGTIAASAGVGAAGGTLVAPGVGSIVGAIGGAIAGAIEAAVEESRDNPYEGKSKGDWFVESDQDTRIHYGEMVLPNRVATAVRKELAVGKTSPASSRLSGGDTNVNIYLTVQSASDAEAVQFANRVRKIISRDDELFAIGSGRFA